MSGEYKKVESVHLVDDKEDYSILFDNKNSKSLILVVMKCTLDTLEEKKVSKYLYPREAMILFSPKGVTGIEIIIYKDTCKSKIIMLKEYICTMTNRNYEINEVKGSTFINVYNPVCIGPPAICTNDESVERDSAKGKYVSLDNGTLLERFKVEVSYTLNSEQISKSTGTIYGGQTKIIDLPDGATNILIKIKQDKFIAIWRTVYEAAYNSASNHIYQVVSVGMFSCRLDEICSE